MIGALCMVALVPITLAAFYLIGVPALTPWHFVYFKASFAAVEAVLITPFLALWAISDSPAVEPQLQAVG
jgi:hypothetical protein